MKEKLLQSFGHLLDSIISSAPRVAVGILLVILAFVVAKLIEISLRFVLTRIRFDALLEKTGESGADTQEHNDPEPSHGESQRQTARKHQYVNEQNVNDDRSE